VSLLAAESLHLGYGYAGDADLVERVLHIVELERLDDRFDLLHAGVLSAPSYAWDALKAPWPDAAMR
jgi:hypothetical protein